jgi:hypothetical protein
MPFFRDNATKMVEKSDLARYAVLHRVGGEQPSSLAGTCWFLQARIVGARAARLRTAV